MIGTPCGLTQPPTLDHPETVMNDSLMALDAERIAGLLAESGGLIAGPIEVLASVDSTNAELLRRVAPDQHSVLLAETQSAGRGRQGRLWQSPGGGNLYVSLYRRFERSLPGLAGLPLAVAVAVAQTLVSLGIDDIAVKWPNDLLRPNGKVGGILIESAGGPARPTALVIGVGLNVRMPANSPVIDQPWADLSDRLPMPIDRNPIAAALIGHLLPTLERFDQQGLVPFLPAWRSFDALRSRTVEVNDGGRRLIGVADGVADDGALLVRHARGTRKVYAGEARVRPAVVGRG